MQTKNNVLSYRIGHDFHDYKLAMERDVNGFSDSNFYYQIKSEKAIEQDFGCEFIRIDPDKEDFDAFNTINEIFRHIKQSSKTNDK